jgi:uncharacterized protein (TIGR02246 family)
MYLKKWQFAAILLVGPLLGFRMASQRDFLPDQPAHAGEKDKTEATNGASDKSADADRAAILKGARDFSDAFNEGNAKAIAAMWTPNGECRDAGGQSSVGRAAIEKSFAESFKANAGARIEVLVKSVRFPAADLAVEEGLLRYTRRVKELPQTTAYVAVHVRDAGRWKIALSSEGAGGQDRLEDLDWLLGEWTTKVKDDAVKFSFARDPKKAVILAKFTRTPPGKDSVSGVIRIALDPETGRIRSWGFEDDGAHSQSLWVNDGKSWILDSRGVLADGAPVAERIVLQRVGPDVITWRAIDRVIGDTALADTVPMRLTRAPKK